MRTPKPVSFYLSIRARQRPFPIDLDDQHRVVFSCNYEAEGVDINSWVEDIVSIIESASISSPGIDTFIGPAVDIPMGEGPYVSIIDTGGAAPKRTHNGTKCEYLSVQVIVRATDYQVGESKSLEIYRELDGKNNIEVNS